MDLWAEDFKEQLKEIDELIEMAKIKRLDISKMELIFINGQPALTTKIN